MPVGAREEIQLAELSSDRSAGFRLKAAAIPHQISRRPAPWLDRRLQSELPRRCFVAGSTLHPNHGGLPPHAAAYPARLEISRQIEPSAIQGLIGEGRASGKLYGSGRRGSRELRLPSAMISHTGAVYPLDAAGAFVDFCEPSGASPLVIETKEIFELRQAATGSDFCIR